MSRLDVKEITELARSLFDYCPKTGSLIRKKTTSANAMAGTVAGRLRADGYRTVFISGSDWYEHRIVWALVNGEMPKDQIDHIDGVRSNNRIENLRECSNAENHQNESPKRIEGKSSNFPGVCWDKKSKKWAAQISINSKCTKLGLFESEYEAYECYKAAKMKFHKFNPIAREE